MSFFLNKEATKNLSLGARGEKAAENYLKKAGYKILTVNFCNPKGRRLGEIDIVAKDKFEIVFVEVKTRTLNTFSNQTPPEESITRQKLYKLNKTASFYLNRFNLKNHSFRFDAIVILADPQNNKAELRHIKNIFL